VKIDEVYAEGRGRIVELVAGLSDDAAQAPVPTCPEWTVADVVAHLTGICADVLEGNIEGVATDPWTEAQVSARRGATIDALVSEWNEVAPQVEALVEIFPEPMARQWVTDLTTHEHDIRTALAQPGARDSTGVDIGIDFVVTIGFLPSIAEHGLPPLEVRAGDRSWTDESTAAAGTLDSSPFELLRALTGRRSPAQIRALDWSVDPEPYVPAFVFGPFTTTRTDIIE
jgi:uncharacterized protein (TIGR03083 family)